MRYFRQLLPVLTVILIAISSMPTGGDEEEFDPRTLEKVWEYTRESNEATFWKLAWSPDNMLVAATFFDNTCVVLNATDGTVEAELDLGEEEATRCDGFAPEGTKPLRACAFSPDGRYLATGGDALEVVVFHVGTWERKYTLRGHEGSILCLDFSPGGKYLASGSGTDKVIPQNAGENITRIWDMETGFPVLTLKGHRDGVLGVKFSHSGDRIATCSDDRTIRVWSFPGGEEIYNSSGHTTGVLDIGWSPDDSLLITGSRDYKIKVWNATSGEVLDTWEDYNCVRSVDVHPNGELAATSGVDLTLKIRDMNTGLPIVTIKDGMEQHAMVMSSRWSGDGRQLASGLGKSHTVILYSFGGTVRSPSEDGSGAARWITVTVMVLIAVVITAALYIPVARQIRRRRG